MRSFGGTIDPSVPDSNVEYGTKYECATNLWCVRDKLNTQLKRLKVIDSLHILTAAHVVEGSITQHVLYKGKAYPCSIVAIHTMIVR